MNKSRFAAGAAWVVVCLLSIDAANAQSVPLPWAARDIGEPALAGSSWSSNGIFSIDAGGTDISGSADQFHFVYQQVSGDVDIRARIDDVTKAHVWSKAGVMIRGSLSPGAAHAYAFTSAAKGTAVHVRQADNSRTMALAEGVESPPRWLRLVRVGSAVAAYVSDDGENWTEMGRGTIELGTPAYVGIAVTGRSRNTRTSATVSNVQVTVPSAPVEEPLPEGQSSADIGSPAIPGRASYSNGRYTIGGSGADIWGAADQFHYVYQPVAGDVDVVARVESLAAANQGAKAGVMIRESLSPGARHALAFVSTGEGLAFRRRAAPDTWSENSTGGTGTAPVWLRLVREGSLISAYRSPDGVNWTAIGSDTIAMAETVFVGMAVTSRDAAAAATAVVTNLNVTVTPAATNRPPAVLVSAPANGSTFTASATVALTASATDSDGTIERVEFRANGTLIVSDTTAPYAASATLPQGIHAITAVAVDDDGATTVSDAVSITVTAPVDPPGAVTFTVSPDHDTLVIRYVLEVYNVGATPGVSAPVATYDLGKPVPSSMGDATVDCLAFFQALAPGSYLAAVNAMGTNTSARSTPVSFTR